MDRILFPYFYFYISILLIRFLHLWVQQGVYEDPFNEFGICINSRFISRKGKF